VVQLRSEQLHRGREEQPQRKAVAQLDRRRHSFAHTDNDNHDNHDNHTDDYADHYADNDTDDYADNDTDASAFAIGAARWWLFPNHEGSRQFSVTTQRFTSGQHGAPVQLGTTT
jgi:hypothetical protein